MASLRSLNRAPFATPVRRIITALILGVAIICIDLWSGVELWKLALHLAVVAFWIVSELALLWYVRSRPDGGASLPVAIGEGQHDDTSGSPLG